MKHVEQMEINQLSLELGKKGINTNKLIIERRLKKIKKKDLCTFPQRILHR